MPIKNFKTNKNLRDILREVVNLRNKNLKEKSKTTRKKNNKLQELLLKDIRQVTLIGKPVRIDGRIVVKRRNGYIKIYPNWSACRKAETKYKLKNKSYAKYKQHSRTKTLNSQRHSTKT
jgi:hypothetical protein